MHSIAADLNSCHILQGRIQDFHLGGGGGGGGAKDYVPARTHYDRGTELTVGRGSGPA